IAPPPRAAGGRSRTARRCCRRRSLHGPCALPLASPLPAQCRIAADPADNFPRPGEEPLSLLRPIPELPQPLAGVEQNLVEPQRLDLQVGADLLLAVVGEIETNEELAVAVETELVEEPLHLPRLLLGEDPIERSRVTAGAHRQRTEPLLFALVEGAVARLL